MELLCHEKMIDYVDFELARVGQVRSPFQIETAEPILEGEESKTETRKVPKKIFLAVDGEFYQVENCRRITYLIDVEVPKLKILKRVRQRNKQGT